MATEAVSASLTIDAPPAAVFAVLADTTTHADIDGTCWVRGAVGVDQIEAVGQVFRMAMHHPKHPDGTYETANLVVVFDAPGAIAWKTGTQDTATDTKGTSTSNPGELRERLDPDRTGPLGLWYHVSR